MNKFMHGNNMGGQSIVDRALAARHTVAGQSLAKVICKATTEEPMGPKRKHLDYLLQCTNEPNISIPQMANLLIDRTQNSSWVVVFKALITVHNLMNYGNERFTQFLASNHCTFHLSNFSDNSNNQSYEMSMFIRRYSKYLNEKAISYRQMAVDFCKVKRGKEDGLLRTMDTDKLLKSLPVLQVQLDVLVEFNASARDLTNGVINSAFLLLFKDLIRLFACYNDGIINLLEKYFDMNKKNCKDALEIYRRFLARMDRVCEVLKVAENIGIDKGDIPDLAKAPSSLLDALEQHLASMDNNKKSTQPSKPKSGITATISNYAAASQTGNSIGTGAYEITEEERKKILEEEQRQLDMLKKERLKQMSPAASSTSSSTSNKDDPFAPLPTTSIPSTSLATTTATANNSAPASSHLNDLLSLNDTPSTFNQPLLNPQQQSSNFFSQQNQQITSLFSQPSQPQQTVMLQPDLFRPSNTFQNSFPSQPVQQTPFNPFLSQRQPFESQQPNQPSPWLSPTVSNKNPQMDFNNAFNAPAPNTPKHTTAVAPTKLIQSDLDSSLATLAGNLNFSPVGQLKKTEHQWSGGGNEKKLTGGNQTNNQWGFNNATTTSSAWNAPFAQNQPQGMMQSDTAIWGAKPAPQSNNQPNPSDQANNPFGLL